MPQNPPSFIPDSFEPDSFVEDNKPEEPSLFDRAKELGSELLNTPAFGRVRDLTLGLLATPANIQRGDFPQQFANSVTNRLFGVTPSNPVPSTPTVTSGLAAVAEGMGFNPDAIKEDYSKGNYGALAADIGGPLAVNSLIGRAMRTGAVVGTGAAIRGAGKIVGKIPTELPIETPIELPKPALKLKIKETIDPNFNPSGAKPRYRVTPEGLKEVKPEESWLTQFPPESESNYQFVNDQWVKTGKQVPTEAPVAVVEPKLPSSLEGSKPRYRTSRLEFESDLDKAAYIAAQPKPSKADAAFVEFVRQHTGLGQYDIRAYGRDVRNSIKGLAEDENGVIRVPKFNRAESGSLVRQFIKNESGEFDPKALSRNIKNVLDKTESGEEITTAPEESRVPEVRKELTKRTTAKLLDALEQTKELREQQELLYTVERGKRSAAFASVKTRGKEGAFEKLSKLAGEYPKVEPAKVKFSAANTQIMFDAIHDSPLRPLEQARAFKGLGKLLSGEAVLQPNELFLLDRVFGKGFSSHVQQLYGGLGLIAPKEGLKPVTELANISRSAVTAYDLSAPFNQGLALIHRPEFWQSFLEMNKSLGGKEWYNNVMDSIYEKDLFQPATERGTSFADEVGMKITDLADYSTREESYLSKIFELIPGVLHSERAYLGFLNKLRADTFESLINHAINEGLDPFNDIPLAKQIASYVNNATGRGSLGKAERYAVPASIVLFSPRFIASRLAFLNPRTYMKEYTHPFVRKQYIKSVGSIVGTGLITLGMSKFAGATVNTDPTNSDFLKAKTTDKTRLDPWGGFQQYITAFSNVITEIKHNYIDNKPISYTKVPAVPKFVYYKLSPAASTSLRFVLGQDPITKQRVTLPDELWRNFVPMFVKDTIEILQNDPSALPTIPLELYGMRGQTYEPRNGLNLKNLQ